MTDLVFATHNPNKLAEVGQLLPPNIRLRTLRQIGCTEEIPETGDTLKENAFIKARYVWETYGYPCFADDTGLLVDALHGAPGVHSARFAGEQKQSQDNINKLLACLKDTKSREARFETVIALVGQGPPRFFTGEVQGVITRKPSGIGGFGYDPVFRPLGYKTTFANFPLAEKNRISHRGKALRQLIRYLREVAQDP